MAIDKNGPLSIYDQYLKYYILQFKDMVTISYGKDKLKIIKEFYRDYYSERVSQIRKLIIW